MESLASIEMNELSEEELMMVEGGGALQVAAITAGTVVGIAGGPVAAGALAASGAATSTAIGTGLGISGGGISTVSSML